MFENRTNPCELVWFAVQTWPRFEKKVAAELSRKDIEVFLPLYSAQHRWSDRWRQVELPLFPTYVFVRVSAEAESRISILRTNGVITFVGARNNGTAIAEDEINAVRTLLTRGISCEPHPFVTVGQRVRIRGGSLDGVEGMLVGQHGDMSMIISIELIQRSLAVQVSGYCIEAA